MIIIAFIIVIVFVFIGLPTTWLLLNARGSHGDNFVYLTFDDGPDPSTTPLILNVLKKYDVKATFFIMGKKAKKFPEIINRIVKEGHELGNHSYSHINQLGIYPPWVIKEEYQKCEQIITKLSNKKMFFARFPQGTASIYGIFILKQMGYKPINWSVEAKDWRDKVERKEIVQKIVMKTKKGSVVLLHDGRDNDIGTQTKVAEALPEILEGLKNKNLQFSTL